MALPGYRVTATSVFFAAAPGASGPRNLRAASRSGDGIGSRGIYLGFRVARTLSR